MIEQLLAGFRAKVYALFSAADPVNQLPARDLYIQFMQPGVPVTAADLDFSLSDASSARAAASFARLANRLPDRWSASGTQLWSIFDDILQRSALAQNTLTTAEQQKLTAARELLYEQRTVQTTADSVQSIVETGEYAMYKQLMTAYERARLKYNNLKITAQFSDSEKDQALWQLNEPIYRDALSRYYGDWVSRGMKNDIESAIQFIDQVTGRGPGLLWKSMKDDLSISKRSSPQGDTYYETRLQPQKIIGQSSKNWIDLTCQLSEAQKISTTVDVSATSGDSGSLDMRASSLSVSLFQAQIVRPWFAASVLTSRAWKWSADSGIDQLLSQGNWPPQTPALMPVYPVSVIFARNLNVSGSQLAAPDSGAVGPFSVSTSASSSSALKSVDVQIIGFICGKTPLSPNPDPAMQWLQ